MRYELSEYEWGFIRPMLPNKPRRVPRVDDRRIPHAGLDRFVGLPLAKAHTALADGRRKLLSRVCETTDHGSPRPLWPDALIRPSKIEGS